MTTPSTIINNPSEVTAIANLVKDLLNPTIGKVSTPDGAEAQVLILPGRAPQSIKALVDEYRKAPERRRGTAELTDLESFIAHVNRFKDDDSAIFAQRDPSDPRLLAVIDYHRMTHEGAPRFGEHRALYAFPLADEWRVWAAMNGKQMSQAQFASFLEDHIADVVDPAGALDSARSIMDMLLCKFASPSRLMDLARGLTVRVDSIVANQQNLASGESVVRFETTHTDERGAPLEVPGAFLIGIPVFRSGARYQLAARLRYRVQNGKVTWWFDLYRAQETFDHAFGEACELAATKTELPLFYGNPEA